MTDWDRFHRIGFAGGRAATGQPLDRQWRLPHGEWNQLILHGPGK